VSIVQALKRACIASVILLAGLGNPAPAQAQSQTAGADQTLRCTRTEKPDDPPFTIEVDEANNTLTYSNAWSRSLPDGLSGSSARFDSRTIRLELKGNGAFYSFNIDRTSGLGVVKSALGAPYDQPGAHDRNVQSITCHAD
jgi:hypothetical protein